MTKLENLNFEEQKAIKELQRRMKKDLPCSMIDDISIFHRFLVAREFDVDKAERMLRKNLAWRKSFQVDTIRETRKPKEYFTKYVTFCDLGLDKDGDIVKYNPLGKVQGKEVLNSAKMNDYMRDWVWAVEESIAVMKRLKEKTGKGSMQFTYVLDLDELTVANVTHKMTVDACLRFNRIFQDNYPELMKSVYIINAPYYYGLIFNLLKPMMSKAMIRKIQVFGSSGWKEKLLEIIDADVLPAFLGGNRTDPDGDPLCKSFVIHGGQIPEKHFLSDEERDFKDKSQVKRMLIPSKEKREIEVDITEIGSMIQWEYLIRNKDIGFGLFYKESNGNLKEVLPIQKIDTIDGTEEDSYKPRSLGKYIILFDNTFSWMSSKEVEYCISVIKPGS